MVLVKNTLFDTSLIGKSVQCRRCPRNCKFRSFVFTLLATALLGREGLKTRNKPGDLPLIILDCVLTEDENS